MLTVELELTKGSIRVETEEAELAFSAFSTCVGPGEKEVSTEAKAGL